MERTGSFWSVYDFVIEQIANFVYFMWELATSAFVGSLIVIPVLAPLALIELAVRIA